jgi:WD40 repeat protein
MWRDRRFLLGAAAAVLGVSTAIIFELGLPLLILIPFALALAIALFLVTWLRERPEAVLPPWPSDKSPYPGLRFFDQDYTDVFFGRDEETDEIIDLLSRDNARSANVIAAVGPSGAGKSSVLRAGVTPRLSRSGSRWVVLPAMVPAEDPWRNLAESILQHRSHHATRQEADELGQRLSVDASALTSELRDALRAAAPGTKVLLVIDQAEELLRPTSGASPADSFLERINTALEDIPELRVVFVIRTDFLAWFQNSPWSALFRRQVNILPLNPARLRDIIAKPAEEAGLRFEPPALVDQMVHDTGGTAALPLLAHVLEKLYLRSRGQPRVLRQGDYEAIGGVTGGMIKTANDVTAHLQESLSKDVILATLIEFASVEHATPTRRRVYRSGLTTAGRSVVEAFVEAYLLTADATDNDVVYAVAHEALLTKWSVLRDAIDAQRENRRHRQWLEDRAQEWRDSARSPADLLKGDRLSAAEQWLATIAEQETVPPHLLEFLEASIKDDRDALRRLSDDLARRAQSGLGEDPELSILLAVAAVQECEPTPWARRVLLNVLANPAVRVLRAHEDAVQAVAWSSTGLIASASDDRTVRVWSAETGAAVATYAGHDDAIWDVAWSPDGTRLATASRDRTVRIWWAPSSAQPLVLRGHEGWVGRVIWSPDGSRLASTSRDGTARLWNPTTGQCLKVLRDHERAIWGLAWSPDGTRLATASDDATARLWEVEHGTVLKILKGHDEPVWQVAFSPDGTRLATASRDRTAQIYDLRTDNRTELRGHADPVREVRWRSQGGRVATGSHDHTARVWNPADGTELLVLRGHESAVRGLAWSPDGRRIVTGSHDRTVRIWEAEGSSIELSVLRGHRDWLNAVAFRPGDERLIATASHDRTARIWDLRTRTEIRSLSGHLEVVTSVAWNRDGRLLATTSHDNTARVWRFEEKGDPIVLEGHQDAVRGVAWSPREDLVATASHDQTVLIWDPVARTTPRAPLEHSDRVEAVAWSPDGQRLATVSRDAIVRLWRAGDGSCERCLYGHEGAVLAVAWSPDGSRLASASTDRTIRLWRLDQEEHRLVCSGHDDDVWSVAWSPSGQRIITGSRDRTARVWDAETAAEITTLWVGEDGISGVAWSQSHGMIAAASRDRTARILDANVDEQSLVAQALRRVSRRLTDEERRAYLLPIPENAQGSQADQRIPPSGMRPVGA